MCSCVVFVLSAVHSIISPVRLVYCTVLQVSSISHAVHNSEAGKHRLSVDGGLSSLCDADGDKSHRF